MEKIHVILSFCIFVFLVLLLSCSGGKRYKHGRKYNNPVASNDSDFNYNPNARSTVGRGAQNRQLKKQYAALSGAEYDDYNALTQFMSLEPEVVASHNTYSQEMDRTTTGPSNMSERSDPNDTVPWIGLRRPNYDVPISSNVRTEASESTDQMYEQTNYLL